MNAHDLKIWPEHYNNVKSGTKTFEIRINDRGFQKGDFVNLYYWPKHADSQSYVSSYTTQDNQMLKFKIGDVYQIDNERVVFSLLKIED